MEAKMLKSTDQQQSQIGRNSKKILKTVRYRKIEDL
jgi:hypothetical protein